MHDAPGALLDECLHGQHRDPEQHLDPLAEAVVRLPLWQIELLTSLIALEKRPSPRPDP